MTESTPTAIVDHAQFELLDRSDEDQILGELSGRVTDKYIYKSPDGPRLSYAGIGWAAREYAKKGEILRVMGKPEICADPTDPDYIIVVVTAQRFAVNSDTGKEIALDTRIGAKRKWKNMEKNVWGKGQDGKPVVISKDIAPDPFYFEKAMSMAQRNALKALMPDDFVAQIVERALRPKAGKVGGGEPAPADRAKGVTPSPARPPSPTGTTPQPAVPTATAPAPAPAVTQPAAAPPAATQNSGGSGATIRQRLYAAMAAKAPAGADKKQIWKDLTGLASTSEAHDDLVSQVRDALNIPTAKIEKQGTPGIYVLFDAKTGKTMFPQISTPPPAPEPVGATQEEF